MLSSTRVIPSTIVPSTEMLSPLLTLIKSPGCIDSTGHSSSRPSECITQAVEGVNFIRARMADPVLYTALFSMERPNKTKAIIIEDASK